MSDEKNCVSFVPFDVPTASEALNFFKRMSLAASHVPPETPCVLAIWSGENKIRMQRRATPDGVFIDVWCAPGLCLKFRESEALEIGAALMVVASDGNLEEEK